MKTRPNAEGLLWIAVGTLILALLVLMTWHFHRDPAQALAFKASRVDLVGRMLVALTSASEAEKSAVLSTSDEGSKTLADRARAATAEVDRGWHELAELLATGGTQRERDLLAQFAEAFANLRRVDDQVLLLAGQNTNLKAYGLAFGPAADALADMDGALSRVVSKHAESPDAKRVMLLAFGARIDVLRIQALLPPHIAEESDLKMDQMEALMVKEEKQVRMDLESLAALASVARDADLETAASSYARYGEIKARILVLSRANTNVRSLALSLNQKRQAMVLCLDALNALQQAILDELIPDVAYGRQPRIVK